MPGFEITQGVFGEYGRLADFDLCIFDYSDDFNKQSHKSQFDKQLIEAMDNGTSVCFVHFNEATPGQLYSTGYAHEDNVTACINKLPGFLWHHTEGIRIVASSFPFLTGHCSRDDFSQFFKKWGCSHNTFLPPPDADFEDVLLKEGDHVLSFAQSHRKGFLLYIPFQRQGLRNDQATEATRLLISNLATYITKRSIRLPPWATTPLFNDEQILLEAISNLEKELDRKKSSLVHFEKVKALMVASEHGLEIQLPAFFESELGIKTRRTEEFVEDFWLVGPNGKDVAICEAKSVTKGFKKGFIYDAYNHREKRNLAEDFPAVLFVNANLQATTWKDKDIEIQPADRKIAADNNVLILRIEDLVRLWDMLRAKKITPEEIITLLTASRGWCYTSKDHTISILDK